MVVWLLSPLRTAENWSPRGLGLTRLLVLHAVPTRRTVNSVLNLVLLGLMALSFVTGWVASSQGLTEFGLHKYASIALLVVAGGHLALHWRSLAHQFRRACGIKASRG